MLKWTLPILCVSALILLGIFLLKPGYYFTNCTCSNKFFLTKPAHDCARACIGTTDSSLITAPTSAPTVHTTVNIREKDEIPTSWLIYKNSKYPPTFRYPESWQYLEPISQTNDGIDVVFYKDTADKSVIRKKCEGGLGYMGYRECFGELSVLQVRIKERDWNYNEFTDAKKRNLDRIIGTHGWGSDKSVYVSDTVDSFTSKIYFDPQSLGISAFVDYSDKGYYEISITGYDSYHGFKDSDLILSSIDLP